MAVMVRYASGFTPMIRTGQLVLLIVCHCLVGDGGRHGPHPLHGADDLLQRVCVGDKRPSRRLHEQLGSDAGVTPQYGVVEAVEH